jgi:hypothetical protein
MNSDFIRIALFFAMIFAINLCYGTSTNKGKDYDICVLMSGKVPDGTIVHLKATYMTDLLHGSVFIDEKCPSDWLGQTSPPLGLTHSSVRDFRKKIIGNKQDRSLRRYFVEITAIFKSSVDGSTPSLQIIRVWNYKKAR